jgi:shikimate dehydrogenase
MTSYRLAVLGDPVEHSRSPQIHQVMLAMTGLEGTYERVRADREILESAIKGMRRGDWHGINITMPLKNAAADLADRLSGPARSARSVNTLHLANDEIHGDSTDAAAFQIILGDERFSDHGTIHILGAGASAAAALTAIDGSHRVYLSSRREERSGALTTAMGGEAIPWGTAVAGAVVINTTPLGMHGEVVPGDVLATAAGLIDLPYGEGPTPAITTSRARGLPHADGHEFLIRQAMASFHIWTSAEIDYESLRAELKKV